MDGSLRDLRGVGYNTTDSADDIGILVSGGMRVMYQK